MPTRHPVPQPGGVSEAADYPNPYLHQRPGEGPLARTGALHGENLQ
jgi:hypothetical protein